VWNNDSELGDEDQAALLAGGAELGDFDGSGLVRRIVRVRECGVRD
jgi:hypothetical protein